MEVYLACGSTVLTSSWWSEAGSTRRSAVSRSMRFSLLDISTAMRTAAAPVRLPERVWRMKSRPSCTVNSMSCMSR